MLEDLKKDARERMAKCVQTFQAELKKQRTGRAHPSLVDERVTEIPQQDSDRHPRRLPAPGAVMRAAEGQIGATRYRRT